MSTLTFPSLQQAYYLNHINVLNVCFSTAISFYSQVSIFVCAYLSILLCSYLCKRTEIVFKVSVGVSCKFLFSAMFPSYFFFIVARTQWKFAKNRGWNHHY